MDDEDDPIVEEIPIYFSKTLQKNLFVLQFPNNEGKWCTDDTPITSSAVKPVNRELKIDFHNDTESEYYDRSHGKNLALACDGKNSSMSSKNPNDRPIYPSGYMDKTTYLSSRPIENANKYFIGFLSDKEIHLTPVTDVLQMRTSFAYFDIEDKRSKAEAKATALQDGEDDEEELQQVTVKFSKSGQTSENVKKALEKSYDHFLKRSADEPWYEAMWYTSKTSQAEIERNKLLCNKTDKYKISCMPNKNYIEKLIPLARSEQCLENILPSKIVSKAKLKNINIINQIKQILQDTRMMSFVEIMTILEECDKDITVEKALRNLPLVGVLLRGNWVIQSQILYPDGSFSKINGVAASIMCRARDYVIYKFSKQDNLHRRKVSVATQLPSEETLEVLSSIAKLNSEKKWELLLPPDVSFQSRHSELVEHQEAHWNLAKDKYLEMDFEKSPKRSRKRSIREVKTEPKQ